MLVFGVVLCFFLFWGGVGSQCNIKNQLLPSELSMIQMEVIYPLKSKTAKRVTWKQLEIIFYSWLINQAILFDLFGTLKRDSQRLSDLQLGDKKVTLNHMGCCFFLFGGGGQRVIFFGEGFLLMSVLVLLLLLQVNIVYIRLVLDTLQETNISPKNGILKMIFLFPRWDMLIPLEGIYKYV